jgi:hypothetical protein
MLFAMEVSTVLEDKIKDMIISRYGSLRNFCNKIDVPYSTIDSILKRGIGKANVLNVIKICNALGLSVDNLKHGIIEPAETEQVTPEDFANEVRSLLCKTNNLTEQQKQHLLNTLNFICGEDK